MQADDQQLLARALERALAWHGPQKRKGTEIPYASHLLQVSGLVLEHGGDVEQAAAGLLHDALEDCDVPRETIAREFGERVARIVAACTDTLPGDSAEKKSPWRERKTAYLAHLREADADVMLVSLCDKRHNLAALVGDLRRDGPATLARFNAGADGLVWYFEELVAAAGGRVPRRLREEYALLLAELRTLATREAPTERELVRPVLECLPDGRLNPEAVGWSRVPLHRCNLRGRRLRQKRWDYWCVTSDTHLLSITYADLGYVGLVNARFLDFASREQIDRPMMIPFAIGFSQPDTVAGGDIRFVRKGLRVEVLESKQATRLRVAFDAKGHHVEGDVEIARPPGHETLSVLVPWDERHFQYTSKHNTRPATGHATVDGRVYRFGPENQGFGTLDYGRGIWPWQGTWNWAAASGVQRGRTVGLNLGGKWTDGTGTTENGLCLDGRLHKLSETLVWEYDRNDWMAPWRIRAPRSGRLDLAFTPFFEESMKLELGLIGNELHVCFGHFAGTLVSDEGEVLVVRDLVGWAEEHRARW